MRFRVIRQQMPSVRDRSRNLRPRTDEAPNQEEGRLCLVSRERFKQSFGVNIVWTIIVSERQMFRIAEMSQRSPVKLRLRRIAVVGEIAHTGYDAGDS